MAIEDIPRRVLLVATGATASFPFPFKIFATNQVIVYRLVDEDSEEEEVVNSTEYTVTLLTVGGTVTFAETPAEGTRIAIVSNVPYTQPMVLTNRGAFYPETINDNADWQAAQIQQVRELATRQLAVPPTSDKTADEVMREILDVAKDAQQYADEARQTLEEARALKDVVVQEVTTEGDTQIERVQDEGGVQADRVEAMIDWALVGYGLGGNEVCWTAQEDIAEGSTITLPSNMKYIVGHHHLRLAYNGVVLMKPANFEEIGEVDHESTTFKIKFPIEEGDEFMAWTVPLGRGDDMTDVFERISELDDAITDIGEHAVYHDMETSSGNG
jgi:hypothetical protein